MVRVHRVGHHLPDTFHCHRVFDVCIVGKKTKIKKYQYKMYLFLFVKPVLLWDESASITRTQNPPNLRSIRHVGVKKSDIFDILAPGK